MPVFTKFQRIDRNLTVSQCFDETTTFRSKLSVVSTLWQRVNDATTPQQRKRKSKSKGSKRLSLNLWEQNWKPGNSERETTEKLQNFGSPNLIFFIIEHRLNLRTSSSSSAHPQLPKQVRIAEHLLLLFFFSGFGFFPDQIWTKGLRRPRRTRRRSRQLRSPSPSPSLSLSSLSHCLSLSLSLCLSVSIVHVDFNSRLWSR